MRKTIVLAVGGLALLAGCKNQQDATIHLKPKWQGAPYHLSFDTKAAKPSTAGIGIPAVQWTANPDALEGRVCLVVQFNAAEGAKNAPAIDQLVMGPVSISGAQGTLPADYMDAANKSLTKLLDAYHFKGKLNVRVLLARSSINSNPGDSEIAETRLSDWLPIELDFHGTR